jgi:hypothetical protein
MCSYAYVYATGLYVCVSMRVDAPVLLIGIVQNNFH